MVSEARRRFLRGAAAVPLLGAFVSPASVASVSAGAGMAQSALEIGSLGPSAPVGWGASIAQKVGKPLAIWRLLRRDYHAEEVRYSRSWMYREGAYEQHIAACRSWSSSFRSHVQEVRDHAYREKMNARRIGVYGEDDD